MLSEKWVSNDTVYYKPTMGLPIYFEYVSKYRRVVVVGVGAGFELRVTYKGIPVPAWSKNYGYKGDALGWAKVQSENRDILFGCLTIKEPLGKRII